MADRSDAKSPHFEGIVFSTIGVDGLLEGQYDRYGIGELFVAAAYLGEEYHLMYIYPRIKSEGHGRSMSEEKREARRKRKKVLNQNYKNEDADSAALADLKAQSYGWYGFPHLK